MGLEIHTDHVDSLNFYQNDPEVQTKKEKQEFSLSKLAKKVKTSIAHAVGKRTALGDAAPIRNALNSTQHFIQHKILGQIRKHLSTQPPKDGMPLDDTTVSPTEEAQMEILSETMKSNPEHIQHSSPILEKITKQASTLLNKQDSPLTKLQEMRASSPVSNASIIKTCQLFEAVRISKAFMAHADKVLTRNDRLKAEAESLGEKVTHGTSVNNVYEIKDPNLAKGPSVAYFKEGRKGEKATGMMEQLMWNISLVMGSDQFAATRESSLEIPIQVTVSEGPEKAENQEKQPVKETITYKTAQGGIQVAQEGWTLYEYNNVSSDKPSISQQALIKGTLATHVFGMYDAHSQNIIVDKNGDFVFFDNARSMPNSNDVINWNNSIRASYRSGLTLLPGSDKPLTAEDRVLLRQELDRYASKVKHLENYLNSKAGSKQLNALPPGWFEKDAVLNAIKERIQNLQTTLNDPTVKTLNDMTMSANPDFKFFAAMQFAQVAGAGITRVVGVTSLLIQSQKHEALDKVGEKGLLSLIKSALKHSVDPGKVMAWCRDPELTFDDVITNISYEISDKKMGCSEAEKQAAIDNGDKIYQEMEDKAVLDNKDLSRKDSEDLYVENFHQKVRDHFASFTEDLPHTIHQGHELVLTERPPYTPIAWIDQSSVPPQIHLLYHTSDRKTVSEPIDYLTTRGTVQIRGTETTLDELKAIFRGGAEKIARAFRQDVTQDPLLSAVSYLPFSDVQARLENKAVGDYILYENDAKGCIDIAFVAPLGHIEVLSLLNTPDGYAFAGGEHTFPTIDAVVHYYGKSFQRRII